MKTPIDEKDLEAMARKYCELIGWDREEFAAMAKAEAQKFLALWEVTREWRDNQDTR
jgi:hypothetical protein